MVKGFDLECVIRQIFATIYNHIKDKKLIKLDKFMGKII